MRACGGGEPESPTCSSPPLQLLPIPPVEALPTDPPRKPTGNPMAPPPPPGTRTTTTTVIHHPHSRAALRRSQEERGAGKKPRPQRSSSFHGRTPVAPSDPRQMRRPKTQPDLLAAAGRKGGGGLSPPEARRDSSGVRRLPAKVLVNVTVQRSLGPVQVMASAECTVEELAAAAVRLYVKEGRRPLLLTTEPAAFGLHYSQFSFECLDPKEKLLGLGSRNFFLCPKSVSASAAAATGTSSSSTPQPRPLSSSPSSSCWKEADKASKIAFPWLRFIDFLL